MADLAALVITVSVARYRATVHRPECGQLKDAVHFHPRTQIPARARVHFCKDCRPAMEDLMRMAGELEWESPRNPMLKRVKWAGRVGFDIAEEMLARADYGNGRIAPHVSTQSGTYGDQSGRY